MAVHLGLTNKLYDYVSGTCSATVTYTDVPLRASTWLTKAADWYEGGGCWGSGGGTQDDGIRCLLEALALQAGLDTWTQVPNPPRELADVVWGASGQKTEDVPGLIMYFNDKQCEGKAHAIRVLRAAAMLAEHNEAGRCVAAVTEPMPGFHEETDESQEAERIETEPLTRVQVDEDDPVPEFYGIGKTLYRVVGDTWECIT